MGMDSPPATVCVFGFTTWAAIAIQTWRLSLPKWRDDLLPLVFLYRDDGRQQETPAEGDIRSPAQEGFLKSYGHSSWAYETVAEQITVQPHKPSSATGSAMRLA